MRVALTHNLWEMIEATTSWGLTKRLHSEIFSQWVPNYPTSSLKKNINMNTTSSKITVLNLLSISVFYFRQPICWQLCGELCHYFSGVHAWPSNGCRAHQCHPRANRHQFSGGGCGLHGRFLYRRSGEWFFIFNTKLNDQTILQFQICDKIKQPTLLSMLGNSLMLVGLIVIGPIPALTSFIQPTLIYLRGVYSMIMLGYASIAVTTFCRAHKALARQGFEMGEKGNLMVTGKFICLGA